jgi:putative serine protease PepD
MSLSTLMTVGFRNRVPAGVDDIQPDQHAPGDRGRGRRLLLGGGITAVLLACLAVLALVLSMPAGHPASPASPAQPTATTSPTLAIPAIYQRILPSMVIVRSDRDIGAGIIVADNGTILTAHHVIKGARHITVTFADGTTSAADLVNVNPRQDTAMLAAGKLPRVVVAAHLGGGPTVGAQVVAIGNPLGLDFSLSSGVVSGLNRSAGTPDGKVSGLIQFDASVNQGSYGGPLVDSRGLVVGIVVSIGTVGQARNAMFAGIGFAAPIGTAITGGGLGNGPQI